MNRAPTVYDVASLAEVSIATVSRYFRQPDKVAETTRQAISSAVATLGYVPSGSARGLAARRTGVIGLCSYGAYEPEELALPPLEETSDVALVHDDPHTPRLYPLFADEVMRGVALECTMRHFALMVGWDETEINEMMISEVAGRVDGLVVLPGVIPDETLEHVARRIPVVVIAAPPRPGPPVNHVTVNNTGGMHALTRHLLIEHGMRDLWFLGLSREVTDGRARFEGFRSALRSEGLPVPDEPHLRARNTRADARAVAAGLPPRTELPEAIVCANDQTALGLVDVLTGNGVRVPQQVAVTGFDGIDAGRSLRPGLTTVRQPMEALGRVAVDLLADQIEQKTPERPHRELPVQVVLRESCGCPAR